MLCIGQQFSSLLNGRNAGRATSQWHRRCCGGWERQRWRNVFWHLCLGNYPLRNPSKPIEMKVLCEWDPADLKNAFFDRRFIFRRVPMWEQILQVNSLRLPIFTQMEFTELSYVSVRRIYCSFGWWSTAFISGWFSWGLSKCSSNIVLKMWVFTCKKFLAQNLSLNLEWQQLMIYGPPSGSNWRL